MPLRRLYLSLLVTLSLCAMLLLPVYASTHAHALSSFSNPITVTSRTYTVHFPNFIDFNASAEDPISTIDRASIIINLSEETTQELHTVPINKAAHTISVSWREDTSNSHFIRPGTQVSYLWQFWDKAGNTLTDTPQQFTTIDSRFKWQHLTQGMLQVNWYNRSQDFGETMLAQASASIQHISAKLGGGLIHQVNLWVYETEQDFHSSLAPGSSEWVGGEALPSLDEASIVVVGTSDNTLVRDMPHELTHLIFHQLTGQGIIAPTWFDEGLAVYNQIYHEQDMTARLKKALVTHTLLRLYEISSRFPSDPDKAYLAYAQSWNLVDYMYSTFGQAKMAQLIKQMNNPQMGFDEDLQQALSEDQLHLENQWRLHLNQSPILTPIELTPTPQRTAVIKRIQNVTTNNISFWLLTGLGILIVLGSLAGLMLLLLFSMRRTRAALSQPRASKPMSTQQGNQALEYPYPDPSTYMQTSMYTQLSSQPMPPVQVPEYPATPPGKQAPQEC
jgi:Peptidase MA superfamily